MSDRAGTLPTRWAGSVGLPALPALTAALPALTAALLTAALLAACNGDGGGPGGVIDGNPPEIARLSPGPCGVLEPGGALRVDFKEVMDPASKRALTVDRVEGAQDYLLDTQSVTFRPSAPLTPGQKYTARLSTEARDEAGNALPEARSWTFRALGAGERAARLTLSGVGVPLRIAPGADPLANVTKVRVWVQQGGVDAARRDFALDTPWDVDSFLSTTVALRIEFKRADDVTQATGRTEPFHMPPDESACPLAYTALAGQFTASAGAMATPRAAHAAARLPDGRVLLAGGVEASTDAVTPLSSTEIFDPRTGAFSAGPPLTAARYELATATLPDGRVIFAGGRLAGGAPSAAVDVYDPALGTLVTLGNNLGRPRAGAAAALLSGGRLAVIGGDGSAGPNVDADVYTFGAGAAAPGRQLSPFLGASQGRVNAGATTLPDGTVLVYGGNFSEAHALLFDGETFTRKTMAVGRTEARGGLIGDALFVMGGSVDITGTPKAIEVYEGGAFGVPGFELKTARESGLAVAALPGAQLLVTGGIVTGGSFTAEAELVSALNRIATANMQAARAGHQATSLRDGTVLITGGALAGPSAEIYSP